MRIKGDKVSRVLIRSQRSMLVSFPYSTISLCNCQSFKQQLCLVITGEQKSILFNETSIPVIYFLGQHFLHIILQHSLQVSLITWLGVMKAVSSPSPKMDQFGKLLPPKAGNSVTKMEVKQESRCGSQMKTWPVTPNF